MNPGESAPVPEKVVQAVAKRPAEVAAPTVWGAASGLLIAFGLKPDKAFAISGFASAITPAVVTFFNRRKRGRRKEDS